MDGDDTSKENCKDAAVDEIASEGFYSQENLNKDEAIEKGRPDPLTTKVSVEEPEFEFDDETGLDLEAQDASESDQDEGIGGDYLHNTHAYMSFVSSRPHPQGAMVSSQQVSGGAGGGSGGITPDGLIDEDFEEHLGSPAQEEDRDPESEFRDIAKYGIIQVAGDDTFGRKVIVFCACRLPPREELDPGDGYPHAKLLLYLKHTLDQYVENDYTLVYFHHGLSSKNKPSFRWLRTAYSDFDRKYKKNLKALYLVHPSNFIKIVWNIFRPIISAKFGRKVLYVNYLHELAQYIPLDQLNIPQKVKDHDALLLAKNKPTPVPTSIVHAPAPTAQFGVSLGFIKEHNGGENIPPVVRQCVDYLTQHGLEVVGIFRRSASAVTLRRVQRLFNEGTKVDFASMGDVHIPAAILKSFLRQLPEPILTYDLYDHIVHVQSLMSDERIVEMQRLLCDELPDDNYQVLKFLIRFLTQVVAHCKVNLMTDKNLAIVFGPNLMWSKSQASLTSLGYVNSCAELLINHYDQLFIK